MVLRESLETVTEYVVRGLQCCPAWTTTDLLRALAVLVYENGGQLTKVGALKHTSVYDT